jgi:hypothetical protein
VVHDTRAPRSSGLRRPLLLRARALLPWRGRGAYHGGASIRTINRGGTQKREHAPPGAGVARRGGRGGGVTTAPPPGGHGDGGAQTGHGLYRKLKWRWPLESHTICESGGLLAGLPILTGGRGPIPCCRTLARLSSALGGGRRGGRPALCYLWGQPGRRDGRRALLLLLLLLVFLLPASATGCADVAAASGGRPRVHLVVLLVGQCEQGRAARLAHARARGRPAPLHCAVLGEGCAAMGRGRAGRSDALDLGGLYQRVVGGELLALRGLVVKGAVVRLGVAVLPAKQQATAALEAGREADLFAALLAPEGGGRWGDG